MKQIKNIIHILKYFKNVDGVVETRIVLKEKGVAGFLDCLYDITGERFGKNSISYSHEECIDIIRKRKDRYIISYCGIDFYLE